MKISFDSIIKLSIHGIVFLTPLLFAPWTFEPFELNKQYLLFFFTALGIMVWFAKMILREKEITFKRNFLNSWIFLFAGASIISTFISTDFWPSLLGSYGKFSDGLATILSLAGFYFLVINNVGQKNVEALLKSFFASLGAVVAVEYLWLFGQIPFNFAGATSEGLSALLAVLMVILVALPLRIWHWALLAGSLGLLMIINFSGAWIILLSGLLGLLCFLVLQRVKIGEQLSAKKILLPAVLSLVAVIFLFSSPFFVPLFAGLHKASPPEAMLGNSASWQIGFSTVSSSAKNLFFGSGLGTFQIDASKFGFSPLRVGAGNFFAELLATEGMVGFIAYNIVAGLFLLALAIRITYGKGGIVFFSAMVSLLAARFVYRQNMALEVAFWMVLALGMASFGGAVREFRISLKKFFEVAFLARVFLLVMVVAAGILFIFGIRFYRADMFYAKIQISNSQITNALETIKLNPYRAEYPMLLSRIYLQTVLDELKKNQSEQDQALISLYSQKAIQFGLQAHALAPNRVAAVEALAKVYGNLTFASGASDWAKRSYETAISLEPANPMLYNELGKLYLAQSDFGKAKEQFEKALSLNPNFKDALVQKALLFEKQGDISSAIAQLKNIALQHSQDSEVLFQLGRMYFNNNQVSQAIGEFQKVIGLEPNHSNAHFALAIAYEKQGNAKKAISEYKKVLELNPGNKEVIDKLKIYNGK